MYKASIGGIDCRNGQYLAGDVHIVHDYGKASVRITGGLMYSFLFVERRLRAFKRGVYKLSGSRFDLLCLYETTKDNMNQYTSSSS